MKAGYEVNKFNMSTKTKFIYVLNYDILNEVSHLCFRWDFKERFLTKKECIGVWKIKNKN